MIFVSEHFFDRLAIILCSSIGILVLEWDIIVARSSLITLIGQVSNLVSAFIHLRYPISLITLNRRAHGLLKDGSCGLSSLLFSKISYQYNPRTSKWFIYLHRARHYSIRTSRTAGFQVVQNNAHIFLYNTHLSPLAVQFRPGFSLALSIRYIGRKVPLYPFSRHRSTSFSHAFTLFHFNGQVHH